MASCPFLESPVEHLCSILHPYWGGHLCGRTYSLKFIASLSFALQLRFLLLAPYRSVLSLLPFPSFPFIVPLVLKEEATPFYGFAAHFSHVKVLRRLHPLEKFQLQEFFKRARQNVLRAKSRSGGKLTFQGFSYFFTYSARPLHVISCSWLLLLKGFVSFLFCA